MIAAAAPVCPPPSPPSFSDISPIISFSFTPFSTKESLALADIFTPSSESANPNRGFSGNSPEWFMIDITFEIKCSDMFGPTRT